MSTDLSYKYKTINGQIGHATLIDSTGTVPQARRLRVSDWSLDISISRKEMEVPGFAFAPASIDTGIKVSGKGKLRAIDSGDLLSLLPNSSSVSGGVVEYVETPAAAASVTVAHAATFKGDHGCDDAAGKPMVRVASAPAVGQYSVNETTGVYTFAVAEAGTLTIYYRATTTTGTTVKLSGGVLASNKALALVLFNATKTGFGTSTYGVEVPNARITKLGEARKAGDFTEWDFEFSADTDALNDALRAYMDQ